MGIRRRLKMNKNSNNKETVSLELPSDILEFLQSSVPNLKEYLEYTILECVKADQDNGKIFIQNSTENHKTA